MEATTVPGKKMDKPAKKSSPLVKIYLFAYNALETIGWVILLGQFGSYYLFPKGTNESLYDSVKWSLFIFQNAAVLEIIHAATGIVPSNPVVTFQQVFSRVMVVCGILLPTIAAKETVGLPLTLFAWCFTEIIRYGYYTLNLVNAVPYFIIWLRYTTFIVLYPIGITGELLCMYAAQQEIGKTGLWTIAMPNYFNFIFNYQYIIIAIMLLYIPVFPQLYMHMFAQRRKIIGGNVKTDKKGS